MCHLSVWYKRLVCKGGGTDWSQIVRMPEDPNSVITATEIQPNDNRYVIEKQARRVSYKRLWHQVWILIEIYDWNLRKKH